MVLKFKTRFTCLLFCSLLICVPVLAQPADNPLFPIEQNDRWGYIDRSGEIVIVPRFEYADQFSEGLAVIQSDGKWGFIDTSGKIVIEPQYSGAHRFSEGLARVQVGGDKYGYYGKWGFIERTGQVVIAPQFENMDGDEDAYDFHGGLAMVQVNGLKGFIDKAGNTVIRPRFQYAYSFSEGLASVSEGTDKKWGYIDTKGAWAIAPRFDWSSLFSEGFAPVSFNGTCGYVDKTGALKLIPKFKTSEKDCAVVWGSFDSGLSRWKIGDKYGFINTRGELVVKPEFDLSFNFSEGMAFVEKDSKYGFIDQTGKMAIEPQFYSAKDFHNSLARVGLSMDVWGYIDKTGQVVWKQNSAPIADEEGSRFLQPGHTHDLLFVGWSPHGSLLASYSAGDGWLKVWNPKSGQLLWNIETTLLKPETPLRSPDGTLFASGMKGKSYQIHEAQSGKLVWTIKSNSTSDEAVMSPDGSMIAERGRWGDACVKIFDAHTHQLIRRLEGHPGIIQSLTFTPDGRLVASAGGDMVIRFWDAQNGAVLKSLFGHTKKITSLAFSGDGKRLVSGSRDDTIKIWDVDDGSLIRSIMAHGYFPEGVEAVTLSHDGKTVVGAVREQIKLWDTTTGKQLGSLGSGESEVCYLMFSPDDKLIVSAQENSTIKLWDVKNARLLRVIKGRFEDLRVAVFSPDGRFIAAGYDSSDSRVELWSVQSGRLVARLEEDSDYVGAISFSRNGTMIATGHFWDDIKVWNTKTGKLVRTFKHPSSSNDRVAFSPDGKYLVSGGWNQNVLLWNVKTGALVWSAIPLDWETEKRLQEEFRKDGAIEAAAEAERARKTAAADKVTAAWKRAVTITFEHFGEAANPLELRMGESGTVNQSLIRKPAADAGGVWLRLRNNSPLPIRFRTDSAYLPRPGCVVKFSDGSNAGGLCDGAEVSIQYQIEEANGKPVAYGLDMSWTSVLPPGASVLFSVVKVHLQNRRTVFVSYSYLKENEKHELEDYGTARRVSLRGTQLRKRR